MAKIKIKKADVWIDMTPMSDVMVLLLTFFMLTSTFVKQEPVKVNTQGSVSEIKVPETNVLNILVGNDGKIFMSMDKTTDTQTALPKCMRPAKNFLCCCQQAAAISDGSIPELSASFLKSAPDTSQLPFPVHQPDGTHLYSA